MYSILICRNVICLIKYVLVNHDEPLQPCGLNLHLGAGTVTGKYSLYYLQISVAHRLP